MNDAGRRVGVRYPNGLSTTAAFETPVAANCSSAPPLGSAPCSSLAGTPGLIECYTLDEEGNRITSHTSSVHVSDPANRLQEDATHAFEYDPNGNMIRKTDKASGETWGYSYTLFDELASANRLTFDASGTPQSSSKTYGYDGFGRLDREVGTSGTISQKFIYYDGEHVVAEADPSNNRGGGNIINWYTHSDGTDDLLAITPQAAPSANFTVFSAPSQTAHYSVHTDHQGSVRAITDLGGIVINSYAYDAYGNAEEAVEGLAQRFRYTGREWDEVTGLYHYRARAFDAGTGRFLQEDPLHFDGLDLNVYRYVGNNPVNFVDPSGKMFAAGYANAAATGAVAGAAQGMVTGVIADCLYGGIADIINKAGVETITGFDEENCVAQTAQRTVEGAVLGAGSGVAFAAFYKKFYKTAAVRTLFGSSFQNKADDVLEGAAGYLNRSKGLRIGYSFDKSKGGSFSIHGEWVKRFNQRFRNSNNRHWDIFGVEP